MTYCSCPGLSIQSVSGPSGIRTHDLLNAIETRSQLRHGPRLSLISGPGGIRTRDLISAIDARSQLRYRPGRAIIRYVLTPSPEGYRILLERHDPVKLNIYTDRFRGP